MIEQHQRRCRRQAVHTPVRMRHGVPPANRGSRPVEWTADAMARVRRASTVRQACLAALVERAAVHRDACGPGAASFPSSAASAPDDPSASFAAAPSNLDVPTSMRDAVYHISRPNMSTRPALRTDPRRWRTRRGSSGADQWRCCGPGAGARRSPGHGQRPAAGRDGSRHRDGPAADHGRLSRRRRARPV